MRRSEVLQHTDLISKYVLPEHLEMQHKHFTQITFCHTSSVAPKRVCIQLAMLIILKKLMLSCETNVIPKSAQVVTKK